MKFEQALAIAVKAHSGQTDKIGEPYILHPLRIMLRMDSESERIVAILHDVVEDSPVNLNDLRKAGFSRKVVDAVDHLTRRKHEPYQAYVMRASQTPLSRKVKVADLEDNMNLRRQHGLAKRDKVRMARYQKAYRFLTGHDF